MIIACTNCPAEYSVPDAKVQGKKVRVTCKHCGTGIIVDGTLPLKPPSPPPPPVVEHVVPPFGVPPGQEADDDATRIMERPRDFSVHEEPTVVGRIPIEALEAERRFAQRTVPPPEEQRPSVPASLAPPPPPAPPTVVIDASIEVLSSPTGPQAPSAPPAAFPVPRSGAPAAPSAAHNEREDTTQLSRHRKRNWPWVLAAVLLAAAAVAVQALR